MISEYGGRLPGVLRSVWAALTSTAPAPSIPDREENGQMLGGISSKTYVHSAPDAGGSQDLPRSREAMPCICAYVQDRPLENSDRKSLRPR